MYYIKENIPKKKKKKNIDVGVNLIKHTSWEYN